MAAAQCLCKEGHRVDLDCEECVNKAVADGTCKKCSNVRCPNYDKSLDVLLVRAAESGKNKAMEMLLSAGVDINCVAPNSEDEAWTPLTSAADCNQIEAVKLLINWATYVGQSNTRECSADLSQSDSRDCSAPVSKRPDNRLSTCFICQGQLGQCLHTPIDRPINQSNTREYSAFINKPNSLGRTALSIAACQNFREIAEILVKNGADLNYESDDEQRPIHFAAFLGHPGIIEILLQAGVSVNSRSVWNGETPLILAACGGHAQTAQFLISKGADMEMQDSNGNRALHLAANLEHVRTVATLIKAGAEVNCENKDLYTPLISSFVNKGHNPIIKMLLKAGADVRMQSMRRSNSALDMAIVQRSGSAQQLALLYAAGTSICQEVKDDIDQYSDTIPQFIIDDQEWLLDLLGLCRKKIRAVLLSPAWGNHKYLSSAVVAQLPLPQLLKEYLLFGLDV